MEIVQGEKRIEVNIDSYEFPYDEKGMKDDNNWLNVKVFWEDEVVRKEGIVPCLLTEELKEITEDIEDFLTNGEESYASDLREKNLVIKMKTYQEDIAFYISFLFKNENEPYVLVKQMKKEEITEILHDLKQQMYKFPIR
ncbi:MAG: hypothetical protein HFG16_07110 [Erysipelotrichaceae bacterium]|jgi:hypothetical protein|nr:hypothetical protein [Erysipelotrichaceae bacterium]